MSKRRVITIDNGGSELRYIANSESRDIHTMEKSIRLLEKDGFRVKDNVEDYDIAEIVKAPKPEYNGMYATGVGYYMYDGMDISMSNQNKKTNTLAWYQQVLAAISIDAMKACKKEEAKCDPDLDDATANFEYILTTLIPVHEHSGTTDYVSKLKDNLDGEYEVKFPAIKEGINTVRFTLRKEHIGVLPEGVVTMTSLRNQVQPNDYTLIIDMGHVTTDLSLCKGINMIGNAVVSSPFAGGTLLKLVKSAIRDYGCVANDDMAIEALQTNKFRIGKKEIDISHEMDNAKRMFISNYIKNEILNQIELAGITAASIQYVVPIGAVLGVQNPVTGNYDILEHIINEVNLDNAEVKVVSDDLRYVNILKAADFCEAFARKV